MFRRKKDLDDEDLNPMTPEPSQPSLDTTRGPATRTPMPQPSLQSTGLAASNPMNAAPAMPPRAPMPSAPTRPAAPAVSRASGAEAETKRLIVGRDIMLSGKITSCDRLIVEGRVEADLVDTKAIEIAPSGFFKGDAEIEHAEIAGRFEGAIIVRQRLLIRATGKVAGTIRYGTIEIEAGGEISGDIQVASAPAS
jgi:cytoskeletal protein CcmA (bactofilin family)